MLGHGSRDCSQPAAARRARLEALGGTQARRHEAQQHAARQASHVIHAHLTAAAIAAGGLGLLEHGDERRQDAELPCVDLVRASHEHLHRHRGSPERRAWGLRLHLLCTLATAAAKGADTAALVVLREQRLREAQQRAQDLEQGAGGVDCGGSECGGVCGGQRVRGGRGIGPACLLEERVEDLAVADGAQVAGLREGKQSRERQASRQQDGSRD